MSEGTKQEMAASNGDGTYEAWYRAVEAAATITKAASFTGTFDRFTVDQQMDMLSRLSAALRSWNCYERTVELDVVIRAVGVRDALVNALTSALASRDLGVRDWRRAGNR